MFGKKAKQIREQEERIFQLESKLSEMEQEKEKLATRVAEFESRESAIVRALTDAATQAQKVVSDAQMEAGAILEQSQADSESAKRDAEQIVDDAYQSARDIVKEAEETSQKKLDDTQSQIEAYVTLLGSYDKLVQENIRSAEESARRYVELAAKLHAAVPQILSADGKLKELPETAKEPQPEAPKAAAAAGESHAGEEKLWTVSEIASDEGEELSHVDAIIDGILGAAGSTF